MNSVREHRKSRLIQLRRCLERYSDALIEWQLELDEATARIEQLSQSEAEDLAAEIYALEKSLSQLVMVKIRVEAGWAMYRNFLTAAAVRDVGNSVVFDAHAALLAINQQAKRSIHTQDLQ